MNNVYFQTTADKFGSMDLDNNRTVETVILSKGNLVQYGAQTMYFAAPSAAATGVKLAGATSADGTINQYVLYNNGEKNTYFVQDDATGGTVATGQATTGTFYNLIPIKEINGIPVYRAVAVYPTSGSNPAAGTAPADLSYSNSCNTGVTYNYFVVNNLNTVELEKGANKLAFSVAGATVTDVAYTAASTWNEITSVTELNNAVSVGYTVTVAIVNNGSTVTNIYVTAVAT